MNPILREDKKTSTPESELHRAPLLPLLCLALVCLGAASMVYYELDLFIPRALESRAALDLGRGYFYGNDFYPIWLTTREARSGHRDLYSHETTQKIQTGLFGRPLGRQNRTDPPADYRQYAYPAFTNLLLWPTALVDFPTLRIIWTVLLPALTALSLWMWLKALDWNVGPLWLAALVIFTLGTHQLLEAFYALQPGLLVGFFLSGAALAIRKRRLLLAGILCALTLIKPQVTALAIFYLLLWSLSDRRRRRLWQGFLVTLAALMAASFFVWPHWIRQWMAVLFGYHVYAPPPLVKVLLGRNIPNYIGSALIAALLAVAIFAAWRSRHFGAETPAFWFLLALLLAITAITVLPGQAIYDHIILIPGILLLLRGRSTARIPLALWCVGATLLVWPFVAAFLLLILRSLLSFAPPAVFYAPAAPEAALPFAVLAMLAWTWKSGSAIFKPLANEG